MEKAYGKIQEVNNGYTKTQKPNHYLVLEGSSNRYYGFEHSNLVVGEEVLIEFELSATGFRNVKKVTRGEEVDASDKVSMPVPASQASFSSPQNQQVDSKVWEVKDLRIARQACLKVAAEVFKTIEPEQVRELARGKGLRMLVQETAQGFEEWVYRENDTESRENENPQ